MTLEVVVAFSVVAGLAILSPGPAILLAIRNGISLGVAAVIWSSLGNIAGIFCLSAAAMLGLGLLLKSSALLFGIVKILGALYLFYVGLRHVFGRTKIEISPSVNISAYKPYRLCREGFFMATINPKPILFFTALFPQFINAEVSLLPQFLMLTSIFMLLSFVTLICYAMLATRARAALLQPRIAKWINRMVGTVFISFGAALLALRRPVA
ncbi:Homoserine/homoserine lactone efflux protein [Nitrincola lacisaponensis]|uniref:Homoserine/homoserine lactone efflux protein n=1 Tax=Nitrincola lacisaponensis TaxID=267850 RepID=A0A063YAP1_9GAMM|nr:LysE family translocator [Nitrincola lacisaponensis]KDE41367.1 Homoserine/homoserine lactone efflux protein [Nitrincola lacisaponensis]